MERAISRSLDLINCAFDRSVANIVIKPNLCYYWDWTTGQTTDPRFVGALINLIRKRISSNVDISIVESDASAMKCKYAYRFLGFEKLAKEYGVRLVNLSEDSFVTKNVTVGANSFDIMVPQSIQKADLKISISKIKYTMEPIKLTCALKNMYGCNPYQKKFEYHPRLGEMIIALNKAMKFNLWLIDGNIVSGSQPRRIGLAMASQDPVAMDVAAAEIAGINPHKIKYLQQAGKEGLGRASYVPKGISIRNFSEAYPRKSLNKKLMGKAYKIVVHLGLGKRLGVN